MVEHTIYHDDGSVTSWVSDGPVDLSLPLDAAGYPAVTECTLNTIVGYTIGRALSIESPEDPREDLLAALEFAADSLSPKEMRDVFASFMGALVAEVGVEPAPRQGVKPALASLGEVQGDGRYRGMGFNGE